MAGGPRRWSPVAWNPVFAKSVWIDYGQRVYNGRAVSSPFCLGIRVILPTDLYTQKAESWFKPGFLFPGRCAQSGCFSLAKIDWLAVCFVNSIALVGVSVGLSFAWLACSVALVRHHLSFYRTRMLRPHGCLPARAPFATARWNACWRIAPDSIHRLLSLSSC